MAFQPSVILLIAAVVVPGLAVELRWNTFEDLSNSPWYINQYYGKTTPFSKPSDLDPRLEGLDANFTGNVWGGTGNDSRFSCDYSLYDDSIGEDTCEMIDIILFIRYYLESPNYTSNVSVWPVDGLGEESYFLQASSDFQWSEVYLELDLQYLSDCIEESIDIKQSLSPGDVLLFDEISIVYSRKRRERNFCDGRLDGVYSRNKGKSSTVWTCSGGHMTQKEIVQNNQPAVQVSI